MNIQQDWNRIDDYFYGDIKTDYLDSKIILKPVMDEMENWGISIDGEIVKKKVIIIPDKAFDDILLIFVLYLKFLVEFNYLRVFLVFLVFLLRCVFLLLDCFFFLFTFDFF